MGFFDFLDEDNDGSSLDDLASTAASGVGGLLEVGGTAAMGVGGSIVAASLLADSTGVGAIAGIPAGIAGGLLMAGGGAAMLSGMALSSDAGTGVAEEAGDFTADLLGTRDVNQRRDVLEPIGDDHYRHLADGVGSPGYGQRLHDWVTGSSESADTSTEPGPTPQQVRGDEPTVGVTPVAPEPVLIPVTPEEVPVPFRPTPDDDVDMVFTEREVERAQRQQ